METTNKEKHSTMYNGDLNIYDANGQYKIETARHMRQFVTIQISLCTNKIDRFNNVPEITENSIKP